MGLFSSFKEKTYEGVTFRNDAEKVLFKKYIELGNKNGWSVKYQMVKSTYLSSSIKQEISAYENRERIYINIIGVDGIVGTGYREWDSYRNSTRGWKNIKFDVIDTESVVNYIFNLAIEYQTKQDDIIKAEEDAKRERERIERENKIEQEKVELYIKRISELNGATNEFAPQFKILREIENIGNLNIELMNSWNTNIEKIYKLRKEFYKL